MSNLIDDLIESGSYREALESLTDMDDEQTRYERLVCLCGLEDYHQACIEAKKAKMLAEDTYYDVVAIYIQALKETEQYEEAVNVLVEELSMPYIPYKYESTFNAAYDEILLAKREANEGLERINRAFTMQDMENILSKKTSDDLLFMAIDQMQSMNIRRLVPVIRNFISNNEQNDFAKSLLIELMIDQEIDEEMTVIKRNIEYDINPSYASYVLASEAAEEIARYLQDALENDNPSLLEICLQFLDFYLYTIYPAYIDDDETRIIAAAIHYYLATVQYIDLEMDDIELMYNVEGEDVYDKVNIIKSIEYLS